MSTPESASPTFSGFPPGALSFYAELEGVLATLRSKDFELFGEQVKTAPRGYAVSHPRIATLRHKELMVSRDFGTPAWLSTRRALTVVRDTWRAVRPLTTWLEQHVGAEEPAARR